MQKTDPRKLTCTSCQHENEIERVYCHNCGEKLDRSLLPTFDGTKSVEDREKESRKVKNLMNPNRFAWVRNFRTFVLLEIFAALVAAGYLATQAPENVPAPGKDRFPELEVGDVWAGMVKAKPSVSVTFKEFDLNYYLRKTVKGTAGPMGIKFVRAFAHLEPGLVTAATQYDLWGLPIYTGSTFKPVLAGGKWDADIAQFAIGRLTIPVGLAKLVKLDTVTLGSLSQVFEKEIKNLDRIEKIEPGNGVILFLTKPQQ